MSAPAGAGAACNRNGKVDGRTFARRALRPGPSVVSLDDPTHAREPDPRAFEFRWAVQTLKHAEQLVRMPLIEADAVVAHEEDVLVTLPLRADLDHRIGLGAREL